MSHLLWVIKLWAHFDNQLFEWILISFWIRKKASWIYNPQMINLRVPLNDQIGTGLSMNFNSRYITLSGPGRTVYSGLGGRGALI